jgi:hypothetical protein
MRGRQQLQKLDPEQLRRTETGVPALPWMTGKKVVDKTIIQVWGKHLQQGSRACLWQLFHAGKTTRKILPRLPPVKTTIF